MKRVLHLVRTAPAALPADVLAEGDVVIYTEAPACLPPAPCFLWRLDAPAGSETNDHVPCIDSATLCELVFQADSVVVW